MTTTDERPEVGEPVDVRRATAPGDHVAPPDQVLWRGRLWQVRRVLDGPAVDPQERRESWRVEVAQPMRTRVLDLVLDRAVGEWRLVPVGAGS